MTATHGLAEKIASKSAKVGVIGLGYVGLPLIRAFTAAGFRCLGFDVDQAKVDRLLAGQSYIKHIDSAAISKLTSFTATTFPYQRETPSRAIVFTSGCSGSGARAPRRRRRR